MSCLHSLGRLVLGATLALGLAAAAAAQPPPAGQAPDPVMARARTVTFPGPEGVTLRALLVPAEGGRRGVPVIALHGCGGIGGPDRPILPPRRERDWAARLSALGYPVLFPDSFGSRGVTEVCRAGEGAILPETLRRADTHAAAAWT
ncbi:MAG: hypothetical protein K2X74_00340, partial [Acetobacteraceae bacterium]|nr:hypothetical protein [Acetobacteraceae bacterium]